MKQLSLSVVFFFAFLLIPCRALAATIQVPTDHPTIHAGIDAAVDGDVVLVSPGTYIENVNFAGKAISVRSETGAENTIINGDQNGSVVKFDSGETEESVLDGFTIRNGTGTYLEFPPGLAYLFGGGILCYNSSSPTIRNCSITDNSGTGGGGVAFLDSSSANINSCTIFNNSAGSSKGRGGGIYCLYSSPTIMGCKIFGNYAEIEGGGLYSYEATPTITNCLILENTAGNCCGGIASSEYSSVTIVNCTISANNAGGLVDGISCVDSSLAITNSIVWGNYLSEISAWECPAAISYSDIKGGWPGEGNIDADPLFLRESDPSHIGDWDYHFYLASPCVDSGTDAGVYTDLEGRTRPLRAGFDMGVYEYPDCVDGDEDRYGDPACGGYDCDDSDPFVNPGTQEVCDNGIDDDCDGFTDMYDLDCGDILIPAHFPTIQEGIDAAPEGKVILVAPGTYEENITFQGKAITLKGEGGAEVTVIDGGQNGVVVRFDWAETEESVLDGFTITNGGNNKYGGGIHCGQTTAPVIKNCIITRNQTVGMSDGAGIYSYHSSPTILNCLIKENWTDQSHDGYGAGIYSGGGLGPTIKNCTIIGNIGSRAGDGGGIFCRDSSLLIEDSAILENIAGDHGAGIDLWDCYDPPVRIIRCTISGNYSDERGGGMYFYRSPGVTVENCIITDNTSEENGAGISCSEYSDLTLTNSIISRNRHIGVFGTGGGLYLLGSSGSHIANCIITENYTQESGGGIYMWNSHSVIENCTIAWNTAASHGGGIESDSSDSIVRNSVVWGNTAPNGPSIGLTFDSITANHSDIQGGEEAVYLYLSSTIWQEGMIDEDPLFAGEEDYRLSIGSPCIDAGNPDLAYNDDCFPPSIGTELNDMGAYGGPGACGWCGDHDGDGHESMVCGGDDCNDAYAAAYPGAEELCDGLDTDCDGIVPADETDADDDGWLGCLSDCDDLNPDVNPIAPEVCNGVDNDCNGIVDDRDADEDGYIDEACGGQDCDDTDSEVHPGVVEFCDGKDSDCDGTLPEDEVDEDEDSWPLCNDCDDTNPAVNPGAAEICEGGIDDDCDGLVDGEDWEECPFLEVEALYLLGSLHINFRIAWPTSSDWATLMILTSPKLRIIPLWEVHLAYFGPPIDIPISFPFPSLGWVGIYTILATWEGDQAVDFEWVDTD